jgi:hypothetical protein
MKYPFLFKLGKENNCWKITKHTILEALGPWKKLQHKRSFGGT